MATVLINYKVDSKQVEKANTSLKNLETQGKKNQKATEDLSKKVDKQNTAFTSLGDKLKAVGNRFTIAGRGAGDMASGLLKGTQAAGGMTKAMKLLKVAIAATGIGLIVIAVTALVSAFSRLQGVQEKYRTFMAGFNAVVDVLKDRLAFVGETIINLINLDFDEAQDSWANATANLTEEIIKEAEAATRLQIIQEQLTKDTNDFVLVKAEARRKTQELLLITRDMTNSFADQSKALTEANKIEEETISLGLKLQRGKIAQLLDIEDETKLQRVLNQVREDGTIDLSLVGNATSLEADRAEVLREIAMLSNMEADSAARRREILNRVNTLENLILAAKKKQAEEDEKARLAFEVNEVTTFDGVEAKKTDVLKEQIEVRKELFLQSEEEKKEADIANKQEVAAVVATIEEDKLTRENVARKVLSKLFKKFDDEKLESANRAWGATKTILRQQGKTSKALAIAEAQINTAVAATQEFSKRGLVGIITGALIVAAGLIQVQKIRNTKIPSFGEGGLIKGAGHDQGGVNINAEGGEFVMSRKAVRRIGISNLKLMNELPVVVNDQTEIAKALERQPKNINVWDEKGYTNYFIDRQQTIIRQQARYTF